MLQLRGELDGGRAWGESAFSLVRRTRWRPPQPASTARAAGECLLHFSKCSQGLLSKPKEESGYQHRGKFSRKEMERWQGGRRGRKRRTGGGEASPRVPITGTLVQLAGKRAVKARLEQDGNSAKVLDAALRGAEGVGGWFAAVMGPRRRPPAARSGGRQPHGSTQGTSGATQAAADVSQPAAGYCYLHRQAGRAGRARVSPVRPASKPALPGAAASCPCTASTPAARQAGSPTCPPRRRTFDSTWPRAVTAPAGAAGPRSRRAPARALPPSRGAPAARFGPWWCAAGCAALAAAAA